MTKVELNKYKRAAKQAFKENGLKIYQKDMVVLETGNTQLDDQWGSFIVINYVMIEDCSTGRQWQCSLDPDKLHKGASVMVASSGVRMKGTQKYRRSVSWSPVNQNR